MSKTGFAGRICRGFALLALLSPLVIAQSTITGVARDTSGAVMAGVRVEAASEALIERSRTATTALDGRYTIVDAGVFIPTWCPRMAAISSTAIYSWAGFTRALLDRTSTRT